MREQISRVPFISIEWMSFIGIESSGEFVAVDDSEDSLVYVEVDSDVEVLPCIVFALIIGKWQFVSLQEDSLWNSGVFNFRLKDVNGVIIKEVVDSAFAGSEVLVGVFDDGFDEKGIINKYLQSFLINQKFEHLDLNNQIKL
jgi:hypothetical protein